MSREVGKRPRNGGNWRRRRGRCLCWSVVRRRGERDGARDAPPRVELIARALVFRSLEELSTESKIYTVRDVACDTCVCNVWKRQQRK